MAAIKIEKFLAIAPKISGEHLPDTAAQTAYNLQLFSGDLLPYKKPLAVDNTERNGAITTLLGLYDPDNNDAVVYLSWLTDVDIAVASDSSDDEQRFYYSGDGAPKVSTFALATTGSEPYPGTGFQLGLPLPTTVPTVTVATLASSTSASRARDSGNIATVVTGTAHGLRTGNVVTIRGFTPAPADDWNSTNVFITVTSTTAFTYFNTGDLVTTASDTSGTIDLAGTTHIRNYVYTWITPWDEESIASEPTVDEFVKEGQTLTLTGLPTVPPTVPTSNFVRGIKIYRTIVATTGTAFFLLRKAWFPRTTATVARTSNVVTMSFDSDHNLFIDDLFKVSGCTDSTFNITNGVVVSVVDDTTITFAQTATNVVAKADTGGTMYHDVAEAPGDAARYFMDNSITTTHRTRSSNIATLTTAAAHNLVSNHIVSIASMTDSSYNASSVVITVTSTTAFTYASTGSNEGSTADTAGVITNNSFLDDFDVGNLSVFLDTNDFDEPDASMVGIMMAQNEILTGFFDNQLCFAEVNQPHAWPIKYRRTFEDDIVAIATIGGYIIVLTERYVYKVTGSNPAVMAIGRVDTPYPCLSKRSVVTMGYGVIWATHGGLALWSPQKGISLITEFVHHWETWNEFLDPSTIYAFYHADKYFATHSTGSFIFEKDERVGGHLVVTPEKFTAAWVDPISNIMFFVDGLLGTIKHWDKQTELLLAVEWKSKVIVTKDYINLGACRVVADYVDADEGAAIIAFNLTVPALNSAAWALNPQLGPINGPQDRLDGSTPIAVHGEVNAFTLNGDNVTVYQKAVTSSLPVTFTLWVDKELIFTQTVSDSEIFRLPSGYKSDTFEVGVSGSARIRSIHLAETPSGLRAA